MTAGYPPEVFQYTQYDFDHVGHGSEFQIAEGICLDSDCRKLSLKFESSRTGYLSCLKLLCPKQHGGDYKRSQGMLLYVVFTPSKIHS